MKILLVDDEAGIREGFAALLRRKGHTVVTAADCAAAAAAVAGGDFDLVVTDWRLPDGTAATFFGDLRGPVVAMSGHPEEVEPHAAIRTVLTKPVHPQRLLALLAEHAPAPAPATVAPLPADVAALLATARGLLGDPATTCHDDGTFVALRAPLPGAATLTRLRELGGDLRVLPADRDQPARIEQRFCRDGRPDLRLPLVRPTAAWPVAGDFAVDFHDTATTAAEFAGCLDRAVAARRAGQGVHFLNLPEGLSRWAESQGRAHDMPMKAPVGPRLPAELAELWS